MSDHHIKNMVNRFLGWPLPDDFSPDAGISFKRDFNEGTPWPGKHQPSGTNLFNADQAEAMVRHVAADVTAKAAAWDDLQASCVRTEALFLGKHPDFEPAFDPDEFTCPGCGATRSGTYCSGCGTRRLDEPVSTV